MEILLLGIYSFFVWLIFFKFKWLPWNIVSQVIVITLPVIGLTALILLLNMVAPSSHDVRVINYVVPINPPVRGLVTEVPIEPNRHIKKGDVMFKIDPTPYEITVKNYEAQIAQLKVQLITAEASQRGLGEQLKSATGKKQAVASKLKLANIRVDQTKELADTGAGNRFDYEQALADAANLEAELAAAEASESQVREKMSAKTAEGEQDEVANVKAQIVRAEAQLADAKWELSQTTYYAPADGRVVALNLRPGAMAVPLPMSPAMNFVEDEQWILAIYMQNEVRLLPEDKDIFLAAGAHGMGAVYTDSGKMVHIIRKVVLRVGTKLDWLILKLH
jgi:multidrug resistance efflux pump